jgi:hypothetical protein
MRRGEEIRRPTAPGDVPDFKESIIAQGKEILYQRMMEAEDGTRMKRFKDFLLFQGLIYAGCSHKEFQNYRLWWLAATRGVEFTRADLEWEDNECMWGNTRLNIDELRKWVMEEIAHRTPGGQIPVMLRKARKHFEPTQEEKMEIMRIYFREPEGPKDLAKRWWRLVKESSLSGPDLAEELDRLREEVKNDKEWRTSIRRTAGRNHQESWLLSPNLEWRAKYEPRQLTQIGKVFQTAGIQAPSKLEEALTRAFETTEDGASSYWALQELKGCRLVTKEKWKEWNTLVRSRFKEPEEKQTQEEEPGLTMKEAIDLCRKAKRHKVDWKEETGRWKAQLDRELKEAFKRTIELKADHERPRLKAPRRLWIEVWTNRPVEHSIVDRWKKMRIPVMPQYTIQEIYQEVRTRWKDRWKVDWEEEQMDPWQMWGVEGRLEPEAQRDWIEGDKLALVIQKKGESFIEDMQMGSEKWKKRLLAGKEWVREAWIKWTGENPNWALEWKSPRVWLPGEVEWFEGKATWQEENRKAGVEVMERFRAQPAEVHEFWRKAREEELEMKEIKKRKKRKKQQFIDDWWKEHDDEELRKLKTVNQEESVVRSDWRVICEEELARAESAGGSEGHLLTHLVEVQVAVTSDQMALSRVVTTLAEGVCGDDPSTHEEEDIMEEGSEGHLLLHPRKVQAVVTGGQMALSGAVTTLLEGNSEDDPSVLREASRVIDAALRRPILDGGRDPEDSPEKIKPCRFKPWRSVKDAIEERHEEGRKAFRVRKRQVKRKEYFKEEPDLSVMSEQAEWESVEKGSKLWEERRALYWKMEAERLFSTWDTSKDLGLEADDREREWKLRHLEIPFIRYGYERDNFATMWQIPENQEPIQEMARVNPLFQEGRFKELWEHHQHPERPSRLDWNLPVMDESAAATLAGQRRPRERWQEIAQQEREEENVVSGMQARLPDGRLITVPIMRTEAQQQPEQQPVQNLGQWIREIEDDERRRMQETPTQRRTRERRELIEENRRYLLRDGRFTQIVEDVRRLPDGPERQDVFRRFWFNLYTQEYQNPLAREEAERLSIRTATLRELEALEDEERRESGGRELVRPLTLYHEDGSLAGGRDRLSPVTEIRVSALE